MAALTSAPFVLLFTFSGIFAQSQDTEKIEVKPGNDVTLPCQGQQGAAIKVLEWKRPDLGPEEFVFFYRDDKPVEIYQLESYRGRVKLRDPEMKNGDTSVILRNANFNDTGTYECFVPNSNRGRRRRAADITQTIYLLVTEPGDTGGHAGDGGDGGHGHVGLVPAFIVAVVCCTGLVTLLVGRSLKKKSESPAADGADVENSLYS